MYPALGISRYVAHKNHCKNLHERMFMKKRMESNEESSQTQHYYNSNQKVYLSNISNLQELKEALSFSRNKFHKKVVKIQRNIGKKYVPFAETLPGASNCAKGIFMWLETLWFIHNWVKCIDSNSKNEIFGFYNLFTF